MLLGALQQGAVMLMEVSGGEDGVLVDAMRRCGDAAMRASETCCLLICGPCVPSVALVTRRSQDHAE
jgi:hypothetical protein